MRLRGLENREMKMQTKPLKLFIEVIGGMVVAVHKNGIEQPQVVIIDHDEGTVNEKVKRRNRRLRAEALKSAEAIFP